MITIKREGPVAILTLNRPDAMNALGQLGDGEAIETACRQVQADPDVSVAILTGAGRAFSAGGDVKAMRDRTGAFGGSPNDIREAYRQNIHRLVRALYNLELPLIAAVNGPAIGLGCDVACLADVRIASERAKFGVTFLKLGLIPGDGGAWLLPRIIGGSRAAEMLYTGEVVDAATAYAWGLVSRQVGHDVLMDEALALANRMAAQPRHALRLAKSLLRQGATAGFETMMELSAASQAIMHQTDDHREGVAAILERRDPTFSGR